MKMLRGSIVLILVAGLAPSLFAPAAEPVQTAYAQVSLQNNTSGTLDLYVDGSYAGRTLRGLFCTSQVAVGQHLLEAKSGSKVVAAKTRIFTRGESYTWTVP
jgi:hypothetical protein